MQKGGLLYLQDKDYCSDLQQSCGAYKAPPHKNPWSDLRPPCCVLWMRGMSCQTKDSGLFALRGILFCPPQCQAYSATNSALAAKRSAVLRASHSNDDTIGPRSGPLLDDPARNSLRRVPSGQKTALPVEGAGAARLSFGSELHVGPRLQWSLAGATVSYPFDSPFPPIFLAGPVAEAPLDLADIVLTFTEHGFESWTLSGLEATTGALSWRWQLQQIPTQAYRAQNPAPKPQTLYFRHMPGGGWEEAGQAPCLLCVYGKPTAAALSLAQCAEQFHSTVTPAAAGSKQWELEVPASGPDDAPHTVTAGVVTRQPNNYLNLAFFCLGGKLHVIDGSGTLLWSRPWAARADASRISGWKNASDTEGGVVFLSAIQPPDPAAPSLQRNTTVTAVAARSGQQLWVANLTAYGSAAFGVWPILGVTATPALALYASGNKVTAVQVLLRGCRCFSVRQRWVA
jgi:hypothetical protein